MAEADLLARARAWMQGATAPAPIDAQPGAAEQSANDEQLATQIATALCRRFEGLFLHPYLCPAGVPSIGYGTTHYADGRAVTLNDPPITKAQAERLLMLQIRDVYLPAVRRLCPRIDKPARLAAIIDWCYNLGAGNLSASTMRRRINAGRWTEVPFEIRKWVMGGGRKLRGLVLRRDAEADLI
ncbi:glycoside hydrolase family protein [Duganella sp. FT135W]|uniref:Lysozyme n=1 Tax=Duganella flavida TaxID=2692175 RepID=A0A6L8KFJ1_9BURK|nr:lysozyme [Duganella flavida]MYM25790.1 glycoside hydrolase family protein [Duganella flavida]